MASVALGAHLVTKTSFFGFFGIFGVLGGYPPILAKTPKNPIFDPPTQKMMIQGPMPGTGQFGLSSPPR